MEMDIVIAVANVKELEERTPIINKLRDEVDNFFKNGWNKIPKLFLQNIQRVLWKLYRRRVISFNYSR